MRSRQLFLKTSLPAKAERVFDWHLNPLAIERMVPPWLKVVIISRGKGPSDLNSQVALRLKIGLFWIPWVIQHQEYIPGKSFTDIQIRGPFKYWKHCHKITPIDAESCFLQDEITYATFFPFFDQKVAARLRRIFTWRHQTLKQDLSVYKRYPSKPLRILVSGTTGFVGHALICFLKLAGHEVISLVRSKNALKLGSSIFWDPTSGELKKEDFENFDAVVHLAGKNISSQRWTKELKKEIFLSRCRDTWLLSEIFFRLSHPPKTFICASAAGYYGNRGEEIISEGAPPGDGFLADVCKKWEEGCQPVIARGTRIVHTRFGAILSPAGGVLQKVLPLFNLGLGAVFGDGKQYFPWIALEDVLYGIYHCLMVQTIHGPVNFTSPEFETFNTFCQKLAKNLHRPLFLRIPAPILEKVFGEVAREIFLPSIRAVPTKLLQSNYEFTFPNLEQALAHMLP